MAQVLKFLSEVDFFGWLVLATVAGIGAHALIVLARMRIKHRERMAMIQRGINPGSVDEAYKKDDL